MWLQALQECQGQLREVVQGIAHMQEEIQELRRRQSRKSADTDGNLAALHGTRYDSCNLQCRLSMHCYRA